MDSRGRGKADGGEMTDVTKTRLIDRVLNNWKTTAIAAAGIVTVVVADMQTQHIHTPQWILTAAIVAKAISLTLAKDN